MNLEDDEIDFYQIEYKYAVDAIEVLENLLDKKPDGRKRRETEEWKKKINHLVKTINTLSGHKIYNILK